MQEVPSDGGNSTDTEISLVDLNTEETSLHNLGKDVTKIQILTINDSYRVVSAKIQMHGKTSFYVNLGSFWGHFRSFHAISGHFRIERGGRHFNLKFSSHF